MRIEGLLKEKREEILRLGGFGNVLVHGYLGIDLERVWNVIEPDFPPSAIGSRVQERGLP
jgi:uncharacterized protein YutE (UPF0331/DUF86 family)